MATNSEADIQAAYEKGMLTSIDQIHAWLKSAITELANHKLKADKRIGESPSFDFRIAARSDLRQQLQMWWTKMGSRVAPEMIWDFVEVDAGLSAQELAAEMQKLVRDGQVAQVPKAIDNELTPFPLFSYHPQRMRAHHPMGKFLAQRGAAGRGFTMEVMQGAAQFISTGMQPYFAKSRLREKLKVTGRREQDIINLACFNADFNHFGKQIFDFPSEMVNLFKRTDVNGIPLEAILLPHKSFFMHFGPQHELEGEGVWTPDGAYVTTVGEGNNKVIQLCLTFAPKVPGDYIRFFENPEPCYVQALSADKLKIVVGEAIDLALSEKMNELRGQIKHGAEGIEEARAEMAEDLIEAGMEISDSTSKFATEESQRVLKLHEIWQTMLRLVVNGIAYLTAYPDDTLTKWPEAAPKALTATLQDGNYKAKSKATGKLAELGFSAIHYCGTPFRHQSHGAVVDHSGADVGSESYTWVRGHWRNQPHGQNRSLRRLVWLMPHRRILTGSDPGAEHGHVYLVT